MPVVYREMRRLAAGYLRSERTGHTLQPTALAHEAYLRLVGRENIQWQNRAPLPGRGGSRDARDPCRSRAPAEGDQTRRGSAAHGLRRSARRRRRPSGRLRRSGPGARRPRAAQRAASAGRRAPVLRRADDRGNGRGPGHLARDREAGLGHGPRVALPRADGSSPGPPSPEGRATRLDISTGAAASGPVKAPSLPSCLRAPGSSRTTPLASSSSAPPPRASRIETPSHASPAWRPRRAMKIRFSALLVSLAASRGVSTEGLARARLRLAIAPPFM